jgi:ADP-heptose:LPS heptosyltransferase
MIRENVPDAQITILTRSDLKEGFSLLEGVEAIAAPNWKRGEKFSLKATLKELNLERSSFDVLIENPDPTKWCKWQLGALVPKLKWQSSWDDLADKFAIAEGQYVGVQVQTETSYGYEKNWPEKNWKELLAKLYKERGIKAILFGQGASSGFLEEGMIDLRGKTTLLEMLSVIKNHCNYLVVPDSGVLSLSYYIDASFPLKIVSLWADPRQGVLKQNVASPNPQLIHVPLLGEGERVGAIAVTAVLEALL